MKCDEMILEAYLNNELTDAQKAPVKEHITICKACERYVAESKSIDAILSAYHHETPDDSFLCSLNKIQYQEKKKFSLFNLFPRELAFAGISIIIALFLGALISSMSISTNPEYIAQEQDILEQISLASLISF